MAPTGPPNAQSALSLIVQLLADAESRSRALRLSGARIKGVLDLEASTVNCPILLRNCYFEEPINLQDAQLAALRLPKCHIRGIEADQLHVRGNLELDEVVIRNAKVSLLGAEIGGVLSFQGATLTNLDGLALDLEAATIG